MAEPYLTELIALANKIPNRSKNEALTCKHFFSGAAARIDGHIFMSLSPVGLALKLPEPQRNAVLDQGGKPLKYFPKSPIKKDYAVLSPQQREDTSSLFDLINLSIDHVLTLAAQERV